jgi:hypothetical protein
MSSLTLTLTHAHSLCSGLLLYYRAQLAELDGWTARRETFVSTGLLWPLALELVVCAITPVPFGESLVLRLPDFGINTYPDNELYTFDELASIWLWMRWYLLFRTVGESTMGANAVRKSSSSRPLNPLHDHCACRTWHSNLPQKFGRTRSELL